MARQASTRKTKRSGTARGTSSSKRSAATRRTSTSRSNGRGSNSTPDTRTSSGRRIFERIDKTPSERRAAGEKLPRSLRNTAKVWADEDVDELETLAEHNTPSGIIGMKLGRSKESIRSKASAEHISLRPTNRSPYGPKHESPKARAAALRNLEKARAARRA